MLIDSVLLRGTLDPSAPDRQEHPDPEPERPPVRPDPEPERPPVRPDPETERPPRPPVDGVDVEELEVPEYNFFDVVVSTRKELKQFVDALPNPGIYTKERPLVVGMKPGNYGRLWFGGGYNQAAEESISHKLGGDLHIHLQSTGTERPEIDGVIMGDWINPVKYLGFTSVRINNHEDRPAPFTQLVHSKESSGYLILDDVILAGDGTNNYGGEGLKWGIKPSSLEGLVVRNVWNLDGPEEHTAYIYGCRGPLQITDVHMTENIGNRTFSQLRWPYAITTQLGDVLYSRITLKGQGQDYAHANGGSTLTFWGAPQSIQKIQDIRVTDSRYGCLRVVGDHYRLQTFT